MAEEDPETAARNEESKQVKLQARLLQRGGLSLRAFSADLRKSRELSHPGACVRLAV
jgi:hypothetical protein